MGEIIIVLYAMMIIILQCNKDYAISFDELFERKSLYNLLLSKFANIKR